MYVKFQILVGENVSVRNEFFFYNPGDWYMYIKAHLRVNVSKNRGKFKKSGHGQKIDFAHTLSV